MSAINDEVLLASEAGQGQVLFGDGAILFLSAVSVSLRGVVVGAVVGDRRSKEVPVFLEDTL